MKKVEEIIKDGRIYTNSLEIGKDGFSGYLRVENVDMSFIASWGEAGSIYLSRLRKPDSLRHGRKCAK